MASDVAQLEPRRKHRRSEKADDEVDCHGVSSETDSPPKSVDNDEDMEEGEILDDGGEVPLNPVHDAEATLMAIESSVTGSAANTAMVSDASRKDENDARALQKSSSGEKSGYFDENVMCAKTDLSDNKTSFPDNSHDDCRTSGNSPYSGRYEDDWVDSGDHHRYRSRDTSCEEDATLKGRKHTERDSSYYSGRYRGDDDSDDRKVLSHEKNGRQGRRDTTMDVERQKGSSDSRYDSRDGTRDRGVGMEIEPGRKREDQQRSRDRDRDKDRKSSFQEQSIDWDSERDSRRDKQKDRRKDKEISEVRKREKERGLNGDIKRDKDRRTVSRRDQSRDRMLVKDRRISKEDDWSGHRKMSEDKREDKKRNRDYDREKESRRSRGRERGRENFEDLSSESRRSIQEISDDKKWAKHRDVRNVDKLEIYVDHGKSIINSMRNIKDSPTMDEDRQSDSEEIFSFEVPNQEEDHLNKIREKSRTLRQAILEKHKNRQELLKQKDDEPLVAHTVEGTTISSSDLFGGNPEEVADDGEDSVAEASFSFRKSPLRNGMTATEKASGERGLGEGIPKSERSDDPFHDEIFGDSPAGPRKTDESGGLLVEKSSLSDNWDDAEGYYCYTLGEVLDGRYEVIGAHGKGVFSTVVRAKDIHAGVDEPKEVAVKILRNREAMYKAGIEELGLLKKLVGADPDDKRHCVRLLSSFKFRNHLCLVFESLNMNLREVLKKFGRNIGLRLTAVRAYAKQLFIAMKHLRNCGVLHCDIKPDNMLVNEAKNMLKLCDFGNAMLSGKNEITPYLVSRFYRAPEIILGLPYDHPMDIWSVGCCLYELYTGKVLFPGPTNNDMLRLHMELKGPFPKKMLRKGAFLDQHFDGDLNFVATEEDPVTKKTTKRMILNVKPKDICSIIKGSSDEDPKMLANFKDLLDKIFVLDPDKRMTVQQALSHPFITGK